MRQNVYYMDSIEVSPAESKGMGASGVGVLDKAVVILSFLSEGGPATLAEVVGGTGLSRPTAHRLLSALEAHRLVGRSGGGTRSARGSWVGEQGYGPGSHRGGPACARGSEGRDRGEHAALREGGRSPGVRGRRRADGRGLEGTSFRSARVLPLDRGSGGRVLLAWAEDGEGFLQVGYGGVREAGDGRRASPSARRGWRA